MTTYREILSYLYSNLPVFHRSGAVAYKASLDTTEALCNLLGNPQQKFPSIHIAGTNGKGSVANFLASILREAGYKTGLYTSPHLKDFRERIRINGRKISRKEVISFINRHKEDFDKINPSFFEMTFGLASKYFADQKVDYAIIETGMGGRLDSTNLVKPILCVVTNIGFDHQAYLGDTLEKIAFEKAGIMKQNVPVVIGEHNADTDRIFINTAERTVSPISFAEDYYSIRDISFAGKNGSGIHYLLTQKGGAEPLKLFCPLGGNYQTHNLITLMEAVQQLKKQNVIIEARHILRGIRHLQRNTGFMGRWQIIGNNPLIICDTGHNEAGIRKIVEQLKVIPFEKLHFVFGMVNDKETGKILDLLPKDAIYYFCRPDIPRGLDSSELMKHGKESGLQCVDCGTVKSAFDAAQISASTNDLIFVGGSTFVVAEVL